MRIRDGDNAALDIARLRLYCLDPRHPRGVCKAMEFQMRLGLSASDAETLRDRLLAAIRDTDTAVPGVRDDYAQRYHIDVEMSGPRGTATVRSHWMTRSGDRGPRFLTCHVV